MSIRVFDVSTSVRRHFQDEIRYCGAACAQMAIAAGQAQAPLIDQPTLYGAVASPAGWNTSPKDLADTLLNYLRVPYEPVAHARSRAWVMRRVAWSMREHGRPAMALVSDGDHWVVIEGLGGTTDDGADPEYQPVITHVRVRDPAPDLVNQRESRYIVAPTPPPHSDQDLCAAVTYAEEAYTWRGWEQPFTRCNIRGKWNASWVAVCVHQDTPSLAAAAAVPAIPISGGSHESVPSESFELRRPDGEGWTPAAMMAAAKAGLRESGLGLRPRWMDAAGSVTVCSMRLVRHLDGGDGYYLLVLSEPGRRGRLLVRLDASTMQVLHAALDPAPTLVEQLLALPDTGRLVWAPCVESRSPFFPMVETGTALRPVYRLLSGRTLPRLTALRQLRRRWER